MLVSSKPAWRYIFPQLGLSLLLLFAYSSLISVLVLRQGLVAYVSVPDLPLSLMGAALGIFLGFRTNSAYDRWWEARMLWGQLVNQSRTLTRQVLSVKGVASSGTSIDPWVAEMLGLHVAFVHALRCHLRGEDVLGAVRPHVDDAVYQRLVSERNIPAALLRQMSASSAQASNAGRIDPFQWQRLDTTIAAITDVQGGCERIKNTPLPRQYDLFPEFFAYIYCLLLPLGLVGRLGYATAPLVVLIGFVFLATNRIGRNIENPFEGSPHDTPMTALSTVIEADIMQALGRQPLPAPPRPVRGVLM